MKTKKHKRWRLRSISLRWFLLCCMLISVSLGYYTRRSLIQADVVEQLRELDCKVTYKRSDRKMLQQIAAMVGQDFLFGVDSVTCTGDDSYQLVTQLWGVRVLSVSTCPKLEDLADISHMVSLEYLRVEECPNLKSWQDCCNLRNLQRVQFYLLDQNGNANPNSNLGDFTWLQELHDLEFIDIFGSVRELPTFSKFAQLKRVTISHFEPDNLDAFEKTTSLESFEILNCPNLVDLGGIRNSKQLATVQLNRINTNLNASGLCELKQLYTIDLRDSKVRFDGAATFGSRLRTFLAPTAELRNLDFLGEGKSLDFLSINAKNIADIEMLSSYKTIRALHIYNSSSSLNSVIKLPALKFIHLENCSLRNRKKLTPYKPSLLEYLTLKEAELDEIPLDLPPTLTWLDIRATRINGVDPAALPAGLKHLFIREGQLDLATQNSILQLCPRVEIQCLD